MSRFTSSLQQKRNNRAQRQEKAPPTPLAKQQLKNKSVMPKLNAWIRPNPLTEDKSDYVAVPQTQGSLTMEDIVKDLQKEGMEIKAETAIDIITRSNRKVAERVLQGYSVNTGLVYMRPVIKGVFYDRTWNPQKHSVYVAINQGNDLRKAVSETAVTILGEQNEPITIFGITDTTTGKTDGTLTKGRNAEIKGAFLKIVGENEANGIVFRNIDTKAETKLPAADIVLNEPSRLLIFVPASLTEGEYELEITTQFAGSGHQLKQPRSVQLDIPVIIG